MKHILLSVVLAITLVFLGFFSVYYNHSPGSIYDIQGPEEDNTEFILLTLDYLDGEEVDLGFYTQAEQDHLKDVRRLLLKVKFIAGLLVLILLSQGAAHWRSCTRLKKCDCKPLIERVLFWGGIGTLVLVVLLALLSLLDFPSFWTYFHEVFFPQGNWLFDRGTMLIQLFPRTFFHSFAKNVLLASAIYGLVSLFASHILRSSE